VKEQQELLLTLLALRENGLCVNWLVTRRHAMAIIALQPEADRLDRPVSRSWCKKFNWTNNFRRRRVTKVIFLYQTVFCFMTACKGCTQGLGQ